MKYSKKIITAMLITIILFVIAVMVFNFLDKQVQTELIIGFLGLFTGEFSLLAWIKTNKVRNGKDT